MNPSDLCATLGVSRKRGSDGMGASQDLKWRNNARQLRGADLSGVLWAFES